MNLNYRYGNEIEYSISVIEPGDIEILQAFSCGNEILDNYIHNDIISEEEVCFRDGLHFKVIDEKTQQMIGFFSLASSGIIHKQGNYVHLLPAVKIDVFAVDKQYQKMHYDQESANSEEDHFYISDSIMAQVIMHCREINEKYALVEYIILYADKNAQKFYERNFFESYKEFMESENTQEINENIPMYMQI